MNRSLHNDIVLDAFYGCDTPLVAAQKLKQQVDRHRHFPTACRVMAKRLRDVCGMKESEPLWKIGRGFVVRDCRGWERSCAPSLVRV